MAYKYFTDAELRCRHCGESHMAHGFMRKLDVLRERCGFPFIVSSAYRCPTHNAAVSKTGKTGPHTTGRAVDILVSGNKAFELLAQAKGAGMTGIGIRQKGHHESRFIHVDDLPDKEGQPRPWVWDY